MIGVTEGTFYGAGNGTHGFATSEPEGALIQMMYAFKVDGGGPPDLFLGSLTPPTIPSTQRSGQYTRDHESGSLDWRWRVFMETWWHDGRSNYDWVVTGDSTSFMVVTGQYTIISASALDTSRIEWDDDVPGKIGTRYLIEGFGGTYSDWNVLMPATPITDGTVGWEFGETFLADTVLDVRQYAAEPTSLGAAPLLGQTVATISGGLLTPDGLTYYDATLRTEANPSNTGWYSVGGYFAYAGAIPPLRQNQRDDLRQNQRTSQQLTVRQRGYL